MNIIYVAPRYHTNQVPVVEGWLKNGDNVMFLCQYRMQSEDYTALQPIVLGYSAFFTVILKLYRTVCKRKISQAQMPMQFNVLFGLPPMRRIKRIVREFQPDVIIYRDRSLYNARIYQYCRKKKIKGILYNQTPYWEEKEEKKDVLHRVIRRMSPQIRMTPVLGKESTVTVREKKSYYVPFVIEPHLKSLDEKPHLRNGRIHIVCVGKYEKRKHHIELLETASKLQRRNELELTFIGESSRPLYQKYLTELKERARQLGMEGQTRILSNLSLEEVYQEYKKADLFVLPSTGEFASISQLEAMSCALPVICSDTNGTADCVHEGENGFRFRDRDFADLEKKLNLILEDKDKLSEMGRTSYKIVQERYNFERYKESIREMMEEAEAQ